MKTCKSCPAQAPYGMFCESCNRMATMSEIARSHWNREEIAGLLRFLGNDTPKAVINRCRGLDPVPMLVMRLCAYAGQLGLSLQEWAKFKDVIHRWSQSEGVSGMPTVPQPQTLPRQSPADLGLEECPV